MECMNFFLNIFFCILKNVLKFTMKRSSCFRIVKETIHSCQVWKYGIFHGINIQSCEVQKQHFIYKKSAHIHAYIFECHKDHNIYKKQTGFHASRIQIVSLTRAGAHKTNTQRKKTHTHYIIDFNLTDRNFPDIVFLFLLF